MQKRFYWMEQITHLFCQLFCSKVFDYICDKVTFISTNRNIQISKFYIDCRFQVRYISVYIYTAQNILRSITYCAIHYHANVLIEG